MGSQKLDDYENKLAFTPVWIPLSAAIENNESIMKDPDSYYNRPPEGLVKEELPIFKNWLIRDTDAMKAIFGGLGI